MQHPDPSTPCGSQPTTAIDCALGRAALYAALAEGFLPPTAGLLERFATPAAIATLRAAAATLQYGGHLLGAAASPGAAAYDAAPDAQEDADLREAVDGLVAVGPATGDLAAAHRRLFGHTARGEAPPYETEYGAAAPVQQPYELADVTGFLRAFGLGVDPARHERVDHVSCECEFLVFLALKEIWAHDRGENATLVETRRATKLFLRDHLARFAPAFGRRLADMDPAGFYGNLGRLLRCLVRGDCARLGIPCGPDLLRLRAVDEPGVPMACGSAGAPCDEGACAVNEPPAPHRSGGAAEG
jgi:TorA maturation chaperone TorD